MNVQQFETVLKLYLKQRNAKWSRVRDKSEMMIVKVWELKIILEVSW